MPKYRDTMPLPVLYQSHAGLRWLLIVYIRRDRGYLRYLGWNAPYLPYPDCYGFGWNDRV